MSSQKQQMLKFYADTPAGQTNKLFVYKVKSYDHAIDLAAKFVQKYNFNIRAAFYNNLHGLSVRIDNHYNLKTLINSQIIKSDIEQKIKLMNEKLNK